MLVDMTFRNVFMLIQRLDWNFSTLGYHDNLQYLVYTSYIKYTVHSLLFPEKSSKTNLSQASPSSFLLLYPLLFYHVRDQISYSSEKCHTKFPSQH